jgi:hypothetical protein
MSMVYAMQRANGDWFALDFRGRSRVPLFSNHHEAMQARSFNNEMLVFQPVQLNGSQVRTLAPGRGEAAEFWLVEKESTNMKRGQLVDYAQLLLLIGSDE